jgi:hypothetical protein
MGRLISRVWPSVLRELVAVTLVVLGLAVAAEACRAPEDTVAPGSPDAQATSMRRTAAAAVQKIIANNYTPTPQPAPTATPSPTCKDAIWWTDARSHIGESRTVQGTIVATRPSPESGGVLLEVGQPFPDPTGLAVLLPSAWAPASPGKTVCVAGRISLAEGRATLQVRDATTIEVVN